MTARTLLNESDTGFQAKKTRSVALLAIIIGVLPRYATWDVTDHGCGTRGCVSCTTGI